MIKVGVTGTGSLVGQAIIKCIKRSENFADAEIVGFDYVADTIGSYWVDTNYILPDILQRTTTHEEIIERVISVIKEEGIQLLFIGIDFDLPLYAEYRSYIESKTNCIVFVSSPRVVEIADDKYKTYQFLLNNHLSCPKTYLYKDFVDQLKYPLILKPAVGAGSKGVSVVENREDLDRKAVNIEEPIVQELIGDAENEYTCGVLMLDDRIVDNISLKRKLHKGNTSMTIFRKDFPEIISEYVSKVTFALKPFGVCNFQLRLDGEGVPKIFEINARHSGTTYFRTLYGYNEIDLILNHFFPVNNFRRSELIEGTAIRYFEETLLEKN